MPMRLISAWLYWGREKGFTLRGQNLSLESNSRWPIEEWGTNWNKQSVWWFSIIFITSGSWISWVFQKIFLWEFYTLDMHRLPRLSSSKSLNWPEQKAWVCWLNSSQASLRKLSTSIKESSQILRRRTCRHWCIYSFLGQKHEKKVFFKIVLYKQVPIKHRYLIYFT